jgi:aconitate hydratase
VIAESYERIHRSNLVGMGILPLEFMREENAEILGLTGHETYDIIGLSDMFNPGYSGDRTVRVMAKRKDAATIEFTAKVRIDTPQEMEYYRHGGILQYVIRQLLEGKSEAAAGGMATTADPSTGSVPT